MDCSHEVSSVRACAKLRWDGRLEGVCERTYDGRRDWRPLRRWLLQRERRGEERTGVAQARSTRQEENLRYPDILKRCAHGGWRGSRDEPGERRNTAQPKQHNRGRGAGLGRPVASSKGHRCQEAHHFDQHAQ